MDHSKVILQYGIAGLTLSHDNALLVSMSRDKTVKVGACLCCVTKA